MQSTIKYTCKGLIVPVFTPFLHDSVRTINIDVIPKYADYLKSKNVTSILINGTVAEGMTMTAKERKAVAEAWFKQTKKNQQKLIIQVGGAPLADVKDLAAHANKLGVSAILCLPELYYKPHSNQELIQYLKEVSDAAPNTPLLYYHSPSMTNVTVHVGRFLESVGDQIPTLAGIKITTNLDEGCHALDVDNGRFYVTLGNNQLITAASVVGIDSFMPSLANLFPEYVQDMIESCDKNNYAKAKIKQEKLMRAYERFSEIGYSVASMKAAMPHFSGIDVGPSRKPLPSFEDERGQHEISDLVRSLSQFMK
ncbi:hypothetical protein QAD02_018517 [Eretmocerus hayati]|uniref:Uncharacterized protein n=1 Tax=Eretmocerus hayati TaxID=131215 RepID=A0ACC2PLT6_9HYME|nr:hypothetical protein QAD02_018517 [Eretmocerus hayati]